MRPRNFKDIAFLLQLLTNNNDPASRERWQRQQSLELEEGEVDKVENASATIRKLGLTLPVLPIQVSHLPHSPISAIGMHS